MNTKSYIVEWHTTVPSGTGRARARFGYTVVDGCGAHSDARWLLRRQIHLFPGERLVVTSVRSA